MVVEVEVMGKTVKAVVVAALYLIIKARVVTSAGMPP